MLLFASLACTDALVCAKDQANETVQRKPPAHAEVARRDVRDEFPQRNASLFVRDTLVAPFLHWAGPVPPFAGGWYIILTGIVTKAEKHSRIAAGDTAELTEYTRHIERSLRWPAEYEHVGFFRYSTDGEVVVGSRLIVFYERNVENAGTVSISCANSETGVVFSSYDDQEHEIVSAMAEDSDIGPLRESVLSYIALFCPSYLDEYPSVMGGVPR